MTWSQISVFNALDAAGLGYAVRSTPAGLPYAGLRWHSTQPEPLPFTILEVDGAVRLTVHAASPIRDAATRMAATRRLALGRFAPADDGRSSDLVVAFRSGEGLSGQHLLALLGYMERSCRGESPALPILGDAVLAARPPAQAAGVPARVEVDRIAGWWRLRSDVAAPHGPVPWSLVDRLQVWAPVGRFLVAASGGLSFEALVPLLGGPPKQVFKAGLADVELCTGTARRHLAAGPERH